MPHFSRQPELPPPHEGRPGGVPADANRRPGSPPPTRQPMAHFAILGLDHHSGENISTVIEARSENDAQEMAMRMGITVHEFKPMHPLAGAAAVKMARSDPRDRFNQHPSYAESVAGTLASSDSSGPADTQPRSHYPGALPGAGAGVPGSVRQPVTNNSLGGLAVLGVVAVVVGLFYLTVLRGGGAQQVLAMIAPPPPPIEAAFDVTEPLGVDLTGVEGFEDWSPDKSIHQIKSTTRPLRLEATVPPSRGARRAGVQGSAVIGGRILTPGHSIAGYRLVQVRDGVVLMQKDGKLVALRMAEAD